jgi:hypothetical protein
MKTRTISGIVSIFALVFASAIGAVAQHEQHGQMKQSQSGSMDMSKMMQEPHHVLAMAYVQNLATFAKALRDQVDSTKAVDGEFARAAVAEMRRSFDSMQQHMADHMKAMPADISSHMDMSHMDMMMQGMDAHVSAIKQSLSALERELQADMPAASKISTSAGEIVKHTGEMGGAPMQHKM